MFGRTLSADQLSALVRTLWPIVRGARERTHAGALDLYNAERTRVLGTDGVTVDPPAYEPEHLATGLRHRDVSRMVDSTFNRTVLDTAQRHATDAGRQTLREAADQDAQALGWSRVHVGTDPPCSFCRMLIGRGPVYHSQQTAGFSAHDHCNCVPMPVFDKSDWDGRLTAKAYDEEYRHATKGAGSDQLNAYRRYVYNNSPR